METKFKIIYAIRFFSGKLETGTIEQDSHQYRTKEAVEEEAMGTVNMHMREKYNCNYSKDMWCLGVQKIDLTVTQIK
ncbi:MULTISPECIES: hypothetical protein [Sphingobacterium]|uniref:hypothetical protein n=1 Tax=Sphingobacterium TaxID=28453 RepID=UPI00257F226E|nr:MULTISPECIES: hypothetical protein [Sphingobacterium]